LPAEPEEERRIETKEKTEAGIIEEVLPSAMFRVRLDDGRRVRAGVAPALRHAVVRLISGTRVSVKLSELDPNRGQITETI
jgi:translation initiation factor IF-1